MTVAEHPSDPDQVCTVSDGTAVVADADITDISVRCVTPPASSALDESFDGDGTVTTPGQRGAYAVAIQPDDQKIVVAGELSLTRYDTSGQLDQGFGEGGSVTTALSSGFLDDAADVAIQPDGKIVVFGIIDNDDGADATGEDFGIQRTTATANSTSGSVISARRPPISTAPSTAHTPLRSTPTAASWWPDTRPIPPAPQRILRWPGTTAPVFSTRTSILMVGSPQMLPGCRFRLRHRPAAG